MSYISEKKSLETYQGCRLRFKLDSSDNTFEKMNLKNIKKMQDALDQVGILLDVTGGELILSILPEKYTRKKNRDAGRHKKYVTFMEDNMSKTCRYSDVVYFMQSLSGKEIAQKLSMPIATYHRHKKSLIESDYFKSLDLNRLNDRQYLESITGNFFF